MPKSIIIKPKNKKRKTIKITKLEPLKINKMPRDPNKKPTKTVAKAKPKKRKV